MAGRRKKWTEGEERTLIDKYGDMVSDGSLSKMKTREKKFRPIALFVNSVHHVQDPIAYPWQWSWKDVSTKVQNMRHQYLLVKQKVKKPPPPTTTEPESSSGECVAEEFDWVEGLSHWSNFLRYKEVFGDFGGGASSGGDLIAVPYEGGFATGGGGLGLDGIEEFEQLGNAGDDEFGAGIDGIENGVLDLEFEYDGDGGVEENYDRFGYRDEVGPHGSDLSKRRRKKKAVKGLGKKALGTILGSQLRETESRLEAERERERARRESREREWERRWEEREKERDEKEKSRDKFRAMRALEWEAKEKEREERERRRRDEELGREREWEERMDRRRSDWKKRMDEMMNQHRAEMSQMQTRILHEQQNLTSQLLGIVSQWTAHPAAMSDLTTTSNQYFSQMMQSLHHVNSLVHDDTRGVEGENQDDQFIVDG